MRERNPRDARRPSPKVNTRVILRGHGPAPRGYVPCRATSTVTHPSEYWWAGHDCSPQWGPFVTTSYSRVDHYHPIQEAA